MSGSPFLLCDRPALDGLSERRRVDVMELVAAFPPRGDEPGVLEDAEVLGDRLPRGSQTVLGGEAGAQLEQRLAVSVAELVEDHPAGGIGQRLEHVSHTAETIGKQLLAYQPARWGFSWQPSP